LAYDAQEIAVALSDSGLTIAAEASDLATRLRELLDRYADVV
jgi:hypothetical protein